MTRPGRSSGSVWTAENTADVFTDLGETGWHHHRPIGIRFLCGCAPVSGWTSSPVVPALLAIYRNRLREARERERERERERIYSVDYILYNLVQRRNLANVENSPWCRERKALREQAGTNRDWASLNRWVERRGGWEKMSHERWFDFQKQDFTFSPGLYWFWFADLEDETGLD